MDYERLLSLNNLAKALVLPRTAVRLAGGTTPVSNPSRSDGPSSPPLHQHLQSIIYKPTTGTRQK
jgi:hypothetical protein